MEYSIVEATRWLQSDFFDAFFKVVSWFGTELFFLIVFTAIYWVYKREFALKFGLFYLISVGVNSVFKLAINRTRPNGGDHSFPSGHSQSFAMQGSVISYEVFSHPGVKKNKKVLVLIELLIAWFVIAYSRLYLNFHFLTDVLGGLLIAILLTLALNFVWAKLPHKIKTIKAKHILQYILIACAVGVYIVFSVSTSLKEKMLTHDSYLTIYELTGAIIGICLGDMLNDRFISYDPSVDDIGAKIMKSLVGFSFLALYYYFVVIRLASKLVYMLPIAFLVMMFLATFVFPLIFKKWSNEDKRIKKFDENKN